MYNIKSFYSITQNSIPFSLMQPEKISIDIPRFENDSNLIYGEEVSIRERLNYIKSLVAISRLHTFTGDDTIKLVLKEFDAADPTLDSSSDKLTELADILDFLSENYGFYGGPYLDYVTEEDTNEVLFFRIIFLNAGRKEWKEIENNMARLQIFTKGYLAVFCMKGFV